MKRRLIRFALLASLLAAGLPLLALAQGAPVVIGTTRLPQSEDTKYPHIAIRGAEVLVASNAGRDVARLWTKAASATSFPDPQTMGPAAGKPDNNSASIFVTATGVTHYAWVNQEERRVYLRSRGAAEADFGPARVVTGSSPDPVEPEVAANEDGVFVFWREPDGPIKYRRSADGVSWDVPTLNLFGETSLQTFDVAAGPGRKLAVAYYRGRFENDKEFLQSFLAIWTGSGFINERVPSATTLDLANPSVALRPDGGFAVAMRSTAEAGGLGAGIHVADRSPSGVWSSVDRIVRGEALSTAIEVDPFGNVHLFFITKEAGLPLLYYTFRRPGQGYGGGPPNSVPATVLTVQPVGPFLTNVRAASETRDRSYGHAVTELFQGSTSFVQYYQVGLPVEINGAASISIEGGAATTNKSTVSVTFSGVTGPSTAVRWSWGAPPAASVPYTPFNRNSPTISVPLPADTAGCSSLTLYTQLRGPTAEQPGANSDSIVFDAAVQAEFFVSGPPPALDPRFTGSLSVSANVFSGGDCSGIATATVSGPVPGGSVAMPVAGNPNYAQIIPLTGDPATPGVKEFAFQATDRLGNTLAAPVTRTLIYDPNAPAFISLAPENETTVVPNPDGTTELRFTLDNLAASDPGGVVAGLQIEALGPPVGGAPIRSAPVRIPFTQMDLVTTNGDGTLNVRNTISLTQFFAPSQLTPGDYSFTIRVVDGAGNVSPESQTRTETLTTLTYPTWIPFVRK